MDIDFSALQIQTQNIYVNPIAGVAIHKGMYHGYEVAVKEIAINSPYQVESVLKEIETQYSLQHPNICRVLGYSIYETHAYILIEWMGQDLNKEIENRKQGVYEWSETELWDYYVQLINAFAFAQSQKVAHRDIKPQNIFINARKELKIGDFGCARYVEMDSAMTLAGSPYYLSPELKELYRNTVNGSMSRSPYNPYKSDVYSLGLTFLHMLLLRSSPELMHLETLLEATNALLAQIQYPAIATLLSYMLKKDQDERCDFLQLFEWLNSGYWATCSQYLTSQDEGMIRDGLTYFFTQSGLTVFVTVEIEGLVVASVGMFVQQVDVTELLNRYPPRMDQCSECLQTGPLLCSFELGTGVSFPFCDESCQQTYIRKYQQLTQPSCVRVRKLNLNVQRPSSQAAIHS